MARMTELVPRPAHRYLAYLAREGLVGEILTTNYDPCIERALLASFGPRWPLRSADVDLATSDDARLREHLVKREPPPRDRLESHVPLRVVTDLETYRRFGGHGRTSCHLRRPILRVYKLNGCAASYAEDPVGEAERIALTERQLQSFRENHWARDLFQDRVRSQILLFSGFGSNEPQIRHTVNLLTRELSNNPRGAAGWPRPFVHERGPSLTFNQHQILAGFCDAASSGGTRDLSEPHEQAFLGGDAEILARGTGAEPPRDGGLDADLFWHAIFVAALRPLVQHYTARRGVFYRWLAGIEGAKPAALAAHVRRWLYPPASSEHELESEIRAQFGAIPALFSPSPLHEHATPNQWPYGCQACLSSSAPPASCRGTTAGSGSCPACPSCGRRDEVPLTSPTPLRLHAWLWAARFRERLERDVYLPLREESLAPLSLALLLSWAFPDKQAQVTLRKRIDELVFTDPGLGLALRIPESRDREGSAETLPVIVVTDGAPPPRSSKGLANPSAPRRPRILRQVSLPWHAHGQRAIFEREGRYIQHLKHSETSSKRKTRPPSPARVRPGTYVRIPLADLVAELGPASDPDALANTVRRRGARQARTIPSARLRRVPIGAPRRSEVTR